MSKLTVTITGAPGSGKSRLARYFQHALNVFNFHAYVVEQAPSSIVTDQPQECLDILRSIRNRDGLTVEIRPQQGQLPVQGVESETLSISDKRLQELLFSLVSEYIVWGNVKTFSSRFNVPPKVLLQIAADAGEDLSTVVGRAKTVAHYLSSFAPVGVPVMPTVPVAEPVVKQWSVYEHRIANADEAKAELCSQVDDTVGMVDTLYLIDNGEGKTAALTGCGPTSKENAYKIVAAINALTSPSPVAGAAVGSKGVVEEIRRLFVDRENAYHNKCIKNSGISRHEESINKWVDLIAECNAALDRIIELPESDENLEVDSDGDVGLSHGSHLCYIGTKRDALQIAANCVRAAALLAEVKP